MFKKINKSLLVSLLVLFVFGIVFMSFFVFADGLKLEKISDKEFNKDKYQKIETDYVNFELPKFATHYWNPSGLDTYEVIISNFSIKNNDDYVLKFTWEDERYIEESFQIHYAFKDNKLKEKDISFIPLEEYDRNCLMELPDKEKTKDSCLKEKKSKLKFNKMEIEIGEIIGYEYKNEINHSCLKLQNSKKDKIKDIDNNVLRNISFKSEEINKECLLNVSYPIYSWKMFEDINVVDLLNDFLAIDDVAVSACGSLSTANTVYTLSNDVNSSGTCFTIAANNITLNGMGYLINYSQSTVGHAIDASDGYDNITIKNCSIVDGNSSLERSYAIYYVNSMDGEISNNVVSTIGTRGYGIHLYNSSNSNNISYNNITTTGSVGTGIQLYTSSNSNTVSKNKITTAGSQGYGIRVETSSNLNTLSDNNITIEGSSGVGFLVLYASNSNNISNNTILTQGFSSYGVYFINSSNTISSNNITTVGTYGFGINLYYYSNSNNISNNNILTKGDIAPPYITQVGTFSNTISNNNFTTIGSDGYGIYSYDCDLDKISNNNITTTGSNGYGIYFVALSNSNNVSNNRITTTGSDSYGIYLEGISDSNTISTNNITTTGSESYGVLIGSTSNNTLISNKLNTTNAYAIYISPTVTTSYYNHTIATSNTEQGEPIYYYFDNDSITIENIDNIGQLYVACSNNITIKNITLDKDGIILANTENSSLEDNTLTITENNGYGIYLYSSDNNNITSCSINSSYSNIGDLYLRESDTIKVINTTYYDIHYYDDTSDLWRYWYLDVYINNTGGNAVNQANVTSWNTNDVQEFSALTNSSGYITRQTLLEYNQSGSSGYKSSLKFGSETFYTNYIVNATKLDYTEESTEVNLTISTEINLEITNIYVTLNTPANDSSQTTPSTFKCSATTIANEFSNITLYLWNSTGDLVNQTSANILGLSNSSSWSIDFTYDDTFTWNCLAYNNLSEGEWADSNNTVYSSITSPAINLNSPSDNALLDYTQNIYFMFTATDSDDLDTCQLWYNTTGTWHKNYTWIGPTSGTMNWTDLDLTDGGYIWNVWCNDTLGNGGFPISNRTLVIDETNPNVTITTTNNTNVIKLSITINYNISDTNIDSCYFTLKDSAGNVHNYAENTTINCSATSRSISTLSYGTFVFQLWGEDEAGNLGDAGLTFVTREVGPSSGGGGTTSVVEIIVYENKTFCGDGICQSWGNDLGIKEDWYNCDQDCPGFDFDALVYSFSKYCFDGDNSTICFFTQTLLGKVPKGENVTVSECGDGICDITENVFSCPIDCGEKFSMKLLYTNCVDEDPTTPCFFDSNLSYLILFSFGGVILGTSFVRVRAPGKRSKVNPYQYVQLKVKRRRWRR